MPKTCLLYKNHRFLAAFGMSEASKEGLGTNDPPITRPTMETAATPGMKAQQRKVNGFPHLHAAQFTQDLLLANQFDRNMTVEKARFEAPPSTQEDDAGLSSSTDGTSVKRSTKKSTKRRARPPPAPRTASPAEVFHHNLIDAVLNVDGKTFLPLLGKKKFDDD